MNKYKDKSIKRCFCLLLMVSLSLTAGLAADEITDVFIPAGKVSALPANVEGISIPGTAEFIALYLEPLESISHDDLIRFRLNNQELNLIAKGRHVQKSFDGTVTWFGNPAEQAGSIVISFTGDVAFGRIELDGRVFKIEPDAGTGLHIVYEVDYSKAVPLENDAIIPNVQFPQDGENSSHSVNPGKKETIDLLVLYTNGFENKFPGAQLQTQINFLVGVVNTSLTNSKIDAMVRLVGTKKVNYTDEGQLNGPLNDLTNNVGVFKDIEKLRDQLGADQVTLLRVFVDSNRPQCGLAWLMTTLTTAFAPFGYSVVQVGQIPAAGGGFFFCTDQTLAHEMGHNWGNNHNFGETAIRAYAVGFRFIASQFRTVMATSQSGEARVSFFSNPNVMSNGAPTGDTNHDVARAIEEVKSTVAKWRTEVQQGDTTKPLNKTKKNFVNGGAKSTKKRSVRVAVFGKDDVGTTAYHVSETKKTPKLDDAGWVAIAKVKKKFKSTINFLLSAKKGVKKVYVRFRDAAGNISKLKKDTIRLK